MDLIDHVALGWMHRRTRRHSQPRDALRSPSSSRSLRGSSSPFPRSNSLPTDSLSPLYSTPRLASSHRPSTMYVPPPTPLFSFTSTDSPFLTQLSTLYTRYQLGFRLGLFAGCYSIASGFSGLIAYDLFSFSPFLFSSHLFSLCSYGVLHIKSSRFHNWQILFLLEGLVTIGFAIISFFVLPANNHRVYCTPLRLLSFFPYPDEPSSYSFSPQCR
jgi:hypothetical protein